MMILWLAVILASSDASLFQIFPPFPQKGPVDCVVQYIEWTACSIPCGPGGVPLRWGEIIKQAKFGGKRCPPLEQQRGCDSNSNCDEPKPVDCQVWFGECGQCSQYGGRDFQRRRGVIEVELKNSGKPCTERTQELPYNTHECDELSQKKEESCNPGTPGLLNVHLVTHTHDDMGWLKTVDQYFWGSKIPIAPGGVNFILNSIMPSLQRHPDRRFTYVEMGFFTRWWMMQDDQTRHLVKGLVNSGQLQFANGGWTANDEAATHYAAIIDQMTLGLGLLNITMGICGKPTVGWSIDAFGHSKEMASLYAQMGMDGLFFARIHQKDRSTRKANKEMEMVWNANDELDKSVQDLFTSVFYNHYSPPNGFCFDEFCDDDPIMDDDRLEGFNVDQKMNSFIDQVYKQAKAYKSNHILLTMGNDFNYMNADRWFYELDKLIKYIKEGQQAGKHNITAFYSTPACYLKALHDAGESWPKKTDDFFPYATDYHSYWTGYFTSRPTLKGNIRKSSALLQVCRQFDALIGLDNTDIGNLDVLKRAVATAQHHDAVTGTAKQAVSYDYQKRLYKGMKECEHIVNDGFAKITKQQLNRQFFCPLANISVCNISQNLDSFTVTLFNALSRTQNDFVRIPVPSANYKVEFNGVSVEADAIKVEPSAANVKESSSYEIVFNATIPPHGFKTYTITKSNESKTSTMIGNKFVPIKKVNHQRSLGMGITPFTIENELVRLSFATTGRLAAMEDLKTGLKAEVVHDFMWYKGATKQSQPSGAYIFRPNGTLPTHLNPGTIEVDVVKGQLVQEVRQTYTPWASQVIRLYKGQSTVELEWTIGPIPVDEKTFTGKEIISSYMTDIENGDTFFTDANGRQIMKRRRNYQETYEYNNTEPVAGNYYPVNTRMFIQDSTRQLIILTDRSQGGTSIAQGHAELMVHRRLLLDDHFGVAEALNETGADGLGLVARGKHWLQLSAPKAAARDHRLFAQKIYYKPVATFAQTPSQPVPAIAQFSGIKHDLPPNVNILTLEQGNGDTVLLRLEHIFQKNEDPIYSMPVTVSLNGLFTTFDITGMEELALGADRSLKDVNRFQWKTTSTGSRSDYNTANKANVPDPSLSITLNPMQIRTFKATITRK